MNKNFKKLAVLVAIMIVTLSIASTGFAANAVKNLAVTYRNIRVFNNGIQANFSNEPFIMNETGTTYVPLRDISTLFNKNISWDNATSTITIQDNPGQSINELSQQIFTLQMDLTRLQDENKKLKEQVGNTSMDLGDLEDDLNDDYDEIEDVTIEDIILDGDKDDIEVEVYIDTTKTAQDNAWDDLDDDDIEEFLQDIVDDILKQFKNADITGFIEDEYNDSKVVKFTISSKDKVVLDDADFDDIGDLEDALMDKFSDKFGLEFDITADEDGSDIELDIWADGDELYDTSESKITGYLEDICEYIVDNYDDTYIYGILEDDGERISFDYEDDDLNWDFD